MSTEAKWMDPDEKEGLEPVVKYGEKPWIPPQPEPDERKWYASYDGGSEWGNPEDSREEAITEALGELQDRDWELVTGKPVSLLVGRQGKQETLSVAVERLGWDVWEEAREDIYSRYGSEDWVCYSMQDCEPTKEQRQELQSKLIDTVRRWENKHGLRPNIYGIADEEEIKVIPCLGDDGEVVDWEEVHASGTMNLTDCPSCGACIHDLLPILTVDHVTNHNEGPELRAKVRCPETWQVVWVHAINGEETEKRLGAEG